MDLTGTRVLVTGVGIAPARYIFRDKVTGEPTHTPIIMNGEECKANLGAAAALECAKAGAIVHLVCRNEDKARAAKHWIEESVVGSQVEYSTTDLNDREHLQNLIESLPCDRPLHWVQSLGVGGGTVVLKDGHPYVPVEEISTSLLEAELSVLTSTVDLLQLILPRLRRQEEARICIVSSMTAIRGYPLGSVHAAAKGAIARFINSARLELVKYNIYVTDIRPGAVDTGQYDSPAVRDVIATIDKSFGLDSSERLYLMPPTAVGKAIVTALTSESNMLSINMVARGQESVEQS